MSLVKVIIMNTNQCLKIKKIISESDCIVVGAGAGFSASGGLDYSPLTFKKLYPELVLKYNMTDWYTSSFYDFDDEAERWCYWAKHVDYSFIKPKQFSVYKDLYNIIKDKDYFIITTNVDGQFLKGNFNKEKIFEVQGSYGKIQCQKACHNKLYDNTEMVLDMLSTSDEYYIKNELVPKCPVCGGNMEMNLRKDNFFVEDETWDISNDRFVNFLKINSNKKILFIELGVGFNTPGIIRYPFENLVSKNKNFKLFRINDMYIDLYKDISDQCILIKGNCSDILKNLNSN